MMPFDNLNDKKNLSTSNHNITQPTKDTNFQIYFKKKIDANHRMRIGNNRKSSSTPVSFRQKKSNLNISDLNNSMNSSMNNSHINNAHVNRFSASSTKNKGSNSVGSARISRAKLNDSSFINAHFISKTKTGNSNKEKRNLTPNISEKKTKTKINPRSLSAKNNISKESQKKFMNNKFVNKNFLNMSYLGNKNNLSSIKKLNTSNLNVIKKDSSKLSNNSNSSKTKKSTNIFSSMKPKENSNNKIYMGSEPKGKTTKPMFSKIDKNKNKKVFNQIIPKKLNMSSDKNTPNNSAHKPNSNFKKDYSQDDIIEEMKNEGTIEHDKTPNKKENEKVDSYIFNINSSEKVRKLK